MASAKRIAAVSVSAADLEQVKALMGANAALSRTWTWTAESEADVLFIDVDSLYGHMDWLRAQGSGRRVLALSNRTGHGDDPVVTRPITAQSVAAGFAALDEAEAAANDARTSETPKAVDAPKAADAPKSVDAPKPVDARSVEAKSVEARPVEARSVEARPVESKPVESKPVESRIADKPTVDSRPASAKAADVATPAPAPAPATVAAPEPVVESKGPIAEGTLLDFCTIEQLPQPSRLALEGHPSLTLDIAGDAYYGPTTLKPLVPYCQGTIQRSQLEPVSSAVLQGLKAAGGAQPLSRLLWLYTLANSNGQLLAGLDANAKYKLTKWPQSEREYPRHFRIATAMMKGPATLTEIADQSGAALADVIDFVNAYSVTGFVEAEGTPAVEAAQPAGLLSRLRARTKRA